MQTLYLNKFFQGNFLFTGSGSVGVEGWRPMRIHDPDPHYNVSGSPIHIIGSPLITVYLHSYDQTGDKVILIGLLRRSRWILYYELRTRCHYK